MRTHKNKNESEKPIHNQTAAKALTPVRFRKKYIYINIFIVPILIL